MTDGITAASARLLKSQVRLSRAMQNLSAVVEQAYRLGVRPMKHKKLAEPRRRGFNTMSKERRSEIASMGGHAAHEKGVAHQWTSEEASAAGKKGGLAKARNAAVVDHDA